MRKNATRLLSVCLVLLCVAVFFFPFHVFAGHRQTSPSHQLPALLRGATMLAIGDSLTVGYFATSQQRDYIQTLINWTGINNLPNIAHYGTDVPATLTAMEQTPPPSADIYLLELGTNDQESISNFSSDYQQIIAYLKKANSNAAFVCLGPWQSYTTQHNSINAAVKAVCPGPFVNLQTLYYASNFQFHGPAGRSTWLGVGDWFHPNDFGHTQIARAVYFAMQNL